ncbi:hypothetical protein K438DRAFT_912741 [Mycena galopus ATCC 62051]|nr:hypothetical protein K438DRAFT_912741 [Mycena galopus ATCC 62051]
MREDRPQNEHDASTPQTLAFAFPPPLSAPFSSASASPFEFFGSSPFPPATPTSPYTAQHSPFPSPYLQHASAQGSPTRQSPYTHSPTRSSYTHGSPTRRSPYTTHSPTRQQQQQQHQPSSPYTHHGSPTRSPFPSPYLQHVASVSALHGSPARYPPASPYMSGDASPVPTHVAHPLRFSVPHDRLFLNALEHDLKREKMGLEPTTQITGEPALSFTYDGNKSLYEQSFVFEGSPTYNQRRKKSGKQPSGLGPGGQGEGQEEERRGRTAGRYIACAPADEDLSGGEGEEVDELAGDDDAVVGAGGIGVTLGMYGGPSGVGLGMGMGGGMGGVGAGTTGLGYAGTQLDVQMCEVEVPGDVQEVLGDEEGLMMRSAPPPSSGEAFYPGGQPQRNGPYESSNHSNHSSSEYLNDQSQWAAIRTGSPAFSTMSVPSPPAPVQRASLPPVAQFARHHSSSSSGSAYDDYAISAPSHKMAFDHGALYPPGMLLEDASGAGPIRRHRSITPSVVINGEPIRRPGTSNSHHNGSGVFGEVVGASPGQREYHPYAAYGSAAGSRAGSTHSSPAYNNIPLPQDFLRRSDSRNSNLSASGNGGGTGGGLGKQMRQMMRIAGGDGEAQYATAMFRSDSPAFTGSPRIYAIDLPSGGQGYEAYGGQHHHPVSDHEPTHITVATELIGGAPDGMTMFSPDEHGADTAIGGDGDTGNRRKTGTFVIYSPQGDPRPKTPLDSFTTNDLAFIETNLGIGGCLVSIYEPGEVSVWIEENWENPLVASVQNNGCSGPFAWMLSPEEPALAIFGFYQNPTVIEMAQSLADSSGFPVVIRPPEDNPELTLLTPDADMPDVPVDFGVVRTDDHRGRDDEDGDELPPDDRIPGPDSGSNGRDDDLDGAESNRPGLNAAGEQANNTNGAPPSINGDGDGGGGGPSKVNPDSQIPLHQIRVELGIKVKGAIPYPINVVCKFKSIATLKSRLISKT